MSLAFAPQNTKLTGTPTTAGQVYVMIIADTDSVVTYTETYEGGTTQTYTSVALDAGRTLYGIFTAVSASSGNAKVSR